LPLKEDNAETKQTPDTGGETKKFKQHSKRKVQWRQSRKISTKAQLRQSKWKIRTPS